MKVYSTSTVGKPPGSRYPNWAGLCSESKDDHKVSYKKFSGKPYPGRWEPIELWIDKPLFPRPDFYQFGGGVWVCNERAAELTGEALEMSGELLPVTVQGESGRFWVYNCTNCINVIDPQRSVYRSFGREGEFKQLHKPAFLQQRFGEETLFKIAEDGAATIYCLERSGEADEGEFKAVVDRYKLTGIEFTLVWTDEGDTGEESAR